MIYIVTGLPGAAKTLFSLKRVLTDDQLINRDVYYHGIPDLKLPWIKLDDPRTWFAVQSGSVVVIDEAQKVFPLRAAGSVVPAYVSAFETHRHQNIDLVLITQDASLLDAHVRKLCERHFWLRRPFGMDYAVVHEFHGVGDIRNSAECKQAIQSRFKHPKELYSMYKSADAHSVKKRVPFKAVLFPLLLLVIVVGGWRVFKSVTRQDVLPVVEAKRSPGANQVSTVNNQAHNPVLPRDTPGYVDVFTPRINALPNSAPIFDKLVAEVKDFPRIAACVASAKACWCYTQQGTRVDTLPSQCQSFVSLGAFDPYKAAESAGILSASNVGKAVPTVLH
jgi:zona occludens toxin